MSQASWLKLLLCGRRKRFVTSSQATRFLPSVEPASIRVQLYTHSSETHLPCIICYTDYIAICISAKWYLNENDGVIDRRIY